MLNLKTKIMKNYIIDPRTGLLTDPSWLINPNA